MIDTIVAIGKMGQVTNLGNQDFKLEKGQPFYIKNESDFPVVLLVQPASMKDGDFVETRFESGWNVDLVKTIKATPSQGIDLKWGY